MKEIWMGQTLGLLSQINPQLAQEIVNKGTVKELEDGVKYIIIEE
jgi:hypothetical protein